MTNHTLNRKFHIPDIRWEIYNANSYEKYLEKYVYPCKFHSEVPEDVLKDYETIERILAFAYYHWPMYDEGVKKLLNVQEMSVKIRCKQLKIPSTFKTKGGKTKRKDLNRLMNDLLKAESIKGLKFEFNKNRTIRNYYSHPDNHSFSGGISQLMIPQIINTINSMFHKEILFIEAKEYLINLKKQFLAFEKGNYILEFDNKKILTYGIDLQETWKINNEWVTVCFINHVEIGLKEKLENDKIPSALILILKNIQKIDNALWGVDFIKNSTIRIVETIKPENTKRIKNHLDEINTIDESKLSLFISVMNNKLGEEIIKHRYENYWI